MAPFGKKGNEEKKQGNPPAPAQGNQQKQKEMADLQLTVLKQRIKDELKQEIVQELKQEASRAKTDATPKKKKEGGDEGSPQEKTEGKEEEPAEGGEQPNEAEQSGPNPNRIPKDINACQAVLKTIFGLSSDIVIDRFDTVRGGAVLLFVDGLADRDLQDRDILDPLKSRDFDGRVRRALRTQCRAVDNLPEAVGRVLDGWTAVFFEGSGCAFLAELKRWDMRSVEPPDAEAVIRGPKEGFNENLRTNTSLLRRKIKTPKLIVENATLGRQTNTLIALVYIEGIVNEQVLKELKRRLAEIDTDAILESGYIEQQIQRHAYSVVPRTGMTQKPDILAAKILEGRIGIICDGTPHAITVPHLFIENLQTAEDYYSRTMIGSFLRLIRLTALLFSLLLPGLFLAITTYHHEMIPSVFLATVINSAEKTPFPLGAELFLLMLMFELLRESGTRLPRAIGSAVSIVGALIIGEAAVNAGIVSTPVVIIVALTAVCGFVNTSLNELVTVYRVLFLILGGVLGLIGIGSCMMCFLAAVASADSFGVNILDSFSREGRRDSILRAPLRTMKFRPPSIVGENKRRQK